MVETKKQKRVSCVPGTPVFCFFRFWKLEVKIEDLLDLVELRLCSRNFLRIAHRCTFTTNLQRQKLQYNTVNRFKQHLFVCIVSLVCIIGLFINLIFKIWIVPVPFLLMLYNSWFWNGSPQ